MIYMILLIIVVGIYEIYKMVKNDQKKEIVIWIVMAVFTIAFGFFYYSDLNDTSLSSLIMDFFNIEY